MLMIISSHLLLSLWRARKGFMSGSWHEFKKGWRRRGPRHANHRFRGRHLMINSHFRFQDKYLKTLLASANMNQSHANSNVEWSMLRGSVQMHMLDYRSSNWRKWALFHYLGGRYELMTNNFSEVFNSVLKGVPWSFCQRESRLGSSYLYLVMLVSPLAHFPSSSFMFNEERMLMEVDIFYFLSHPNFTYLVQIYNKDYSMLILKSSITKFRCRLLLSCGLGGIRALFRGEVLGLCWPNSNSFLILWNLMKD